MKYVPAVITVIAVFAITAIALCVTKKPDYIWGICGFFFAYILLPDNNSKRRGEG
jgi:hypothetical protein